MIINSVISRFYCYFICFYLFMLTLNRYVNFKHPEILLILFSLFFRQKLRKISAWEIGVSPSIFSLNKYTGK